MIYSTVNSIIPYLLMREIGKFFEFIKFYNSIIINLFQLFLYSYCFITQQSTIQKIKMSIDTQFKEEADKKIKLIEKQGVSKYIIIDLLKEQACESWKLMQLVILYLEQKDKPVLSKVYDIIDENYQVVSSITMLIYLYSLKTNVKKTYFLYLCRWSSMYTKIGLGNGDIMLLSAFLLNEPQAEIVQSTLNMICTFFPLMYEKQRFDLTTMIQFNAIIEWVTLWQTKNHEEFSSAIGLSKIIHESSYRNDNDYTNKEYHILSRVMQISGQFQFSSPNIFLFIYPFVLEPKDIAYFCHCSFDFLLGLTQKQYVNFFTALTKSAISKQIVFLINKLTNVLKTEDEFFKLRYIFQKFILPILIRRAKACKKIEDVVFQISQMYLLGFLNHCNIGKQGIGYCIKNISKVRDKEIQEKWLEICSVLTNRYPQQKKFIEIELQKEFNKKIALKKHGYNLKNDDIVWQVTERNSRKYKKYIGVSSKMKGIVNPANQCYIIATVQALHKTQLFEKLLNQNRPTIKEKLKLLDEMRILFQQLKGVKNSKKIEVSFLKLKGPQYFRESNHQEDAQQYIIQLFDSFEKEMKAFPKILQQFKKLFEFTIKSKIICAKCKKQWDQTQNAYTYTIPNTEVLSSKTNEENLTQYLCSECRVVGTCIVTRKIQLTCEILIVHINRFSHEKGITKKMLSTATILRDFMDYQLVGIICHIGKNVEHGHYLYYSRISEIRWAKFNDIEVQQFDLDNKDEEFEKQLKAETTPYILFYRKKVK